MGTDHRKLEAASRALLAWYTSGEPDDLSDMMGDLRVALHPEPVVVTDGSGARVMATATKGCVSCRYFGHPPDWKAPSAPGECRIRSLPLFPQRDTDDWCGEHVPPDCPECGGCGVDGKHDPECKAGPDHSRMLHGGVDGGLWCGDCAWRLDWDHEDQDFHRTFDVAFEAHDCDEHPKPLESD